MVTITLYARQKERHRYIEQTCGLYGRRQGWDDLREQHRNMYIVKQITSPGWMHETSSRGWCTGKTQRNRVEREVGGGSEWGAHVNPWLIHVNVWQKPLQYCKVISLQLIKIKGKKKNRRRKGESALFHEAWLCYLLQLSLGLDGMNKVQSHVAGDPNIWEENAFTKGDGKGSRNWKL